MQQVPVYVVQVMGGREQHVCSRLSQLLNSQALDCFTPVCEVMKKTGGTWRVTRRELFPGYVFVQISNPQKLLDSLKQVNEFCRLLGVTDDSFSPLSDDEAAWLDALTDAGTHVMAMSTGVVEGDRVLVTQGPLKGHEAQIKKIDRHKRLAWLEVHILGRTKLVRVGLEIVRKRANRG